VPRAKLFTGLVAAPADRNVSGLGQVDHYGQKSVLNYYATPAVLFSMQLVFKKLIPQSSHPQTP